MKRKYCKICKRELNVEGDILSIDCGGDCWGCIGEIEASCQYEPSLEQVRKEFREGLRDNWIPSPLTDFEIHGNKIFVSAKFERPLGDPWEGVKVEAKLSSSYDANDSSCILANSFQVSNHQGVVKLIFHVPDCLLKTSLWLQIHRSGNSWSFQIEMPSTIGWAEVRSPSIATD